MDYTFNKFEKIWAYLFFLFFMIQILSPSINGRTIYLEYLIAIFNPYFWCWIRLKKIKYKHFFLFFGIMSFSILGHFDTSLKLLLNMFLVIYLLYLYEKQLWKAKIYMYVSIVFAILQFIFLFIDPEISFSIGSQEIPRYIWGDYATLTYANYYTVFIIPRVSGLAREAGFFASLIMVFFLYIYLEKIKINILEKTLLFIGYILSFSKMSLVIFPVILLYKFKKIVSYIPFYLILILWVIFMILFWTYNYLSLYDSENVTFLSRFGLYLSLLDLNYYQLLFGVGDKVLEINSYVIDLMNSLSDNFSGLAYFIVYNGLISTIIFFISLYLWGISSLGIILLLLFTINVQLDTNQNFVVLSYYIIFKYFTYDINRIKLIINSLK